VTHLFLSPSYSYLLLHLQLPEVHPSAKLLQPPPPILQTETNWPLLTISKGFFDGISAKGPGVITSMDAEDMEPEGWGDDAELLLDDGN
jgi:coatomer protein complex subunit alpha (xenin)